MKTTPSAMSESVIFLSSSYFLIICDNFISDRGYDKYNTILRNISFNVPEKSSIAFVGPSGCGKTTMLKTIIGLEKPDSGSIYIDGVDVVNIPTAKREIALVFQNFALPFF